MARITKMRALTCLEYFQGVGAILNPEVLVGLASQAGLPDNELVKLQMNINKQNMRNQSWQ